MPRLSFGLGLLAIHDFSMRLVDSLSLDANRTMLKASPREKIVILAVAARALLR